MKKRISEAELKDILEKHKNFLNDSLGERADLSNTDLRYVDLGGADLTHAILRNVDLRYADLTDTKLNFANLSYTDLNNADLRNANLNNADLYYTDLGNADLRNVKLSNADLKNAKLNNADLRGARLINADLRYANLRHANLTEASLASANLECANLKDADLTNATIWNANFCNVSGKLIISIQLTTSIQNRVINYIPENDWVSAGCFHGTLEELKSRVEKTRSKNEEIQKRYKKAIEFIEFLKGDYEAEEVWIKGEK